MDQIESDYAFIESIGSSLLDDTESLGSIDSIQTTPLLLNQEILANTTNEPEEPIRQVSFRESIEQNRRWIFCVAALLCLMLLVWTGYKVYDMRNTTKISLNLTPAKDIRFSSLRL